MEAACKTIEKMPSTEDAVLDLEEIKQIAVQACDGDKSVELISHRFEPYSKHTVGFLGSHQALEIEVKRKDSKKASKLKFFVKSVPLETEGQSLFIREQRVFNHEAEFFNKVMPHLLEATSVGEIEPWAPKCYLANDEVIVLEDLRTRGFDTLKTKCFEAETLESAARSMARLHAATILAEKRLGKRLDELYPAACTEQIFTEQMIKYGTHLIDSLVAEVADRNGRSHDKSRVALERAYDYVNKGNRELRVMCHGDAWPNNVMINQSSGECLLVDYQLVRYAPKMFDVAQLVYLSSSKEVRLKEKKRVLRAYRKELCETLSKCEPAELELPSLEQLEKEYEEAKLAGLTIALMYYPTILLSREVYEQYADDPATLYKKFVFRPNNDCVLELMDQDEVYNKRIVETVLEFLDVCEKLKVGDA